MMISFIHLWVRWPVRQEMGQIERAIQLVSVLACLSVSCLADPPAQPLLQGPGGMVAVEFSDFRCGPCGEVSELLRRFSSSRNIPLQVIFKHAPAEPSALSAHEAALAAGKQGKFSEMSDLLFQDQNAGPLEIQAFARKIGLDMDAFEKSIRGHDFRSRVLQDAAEARGLGIRMTPTLYLNGVRLEGIEQIKTLLAAPADSDAGLSQTPPVAAPGKSAADNPTTPLAFDLTGSPAMGPDNAPVTIVEFSDFGCGFCGPNSLALTELAKLHSGKVRRVFKHFPSQMDEAGWMPHLASMAALRQGRFWELHESMMRRPVVSRDDLVQRASDLGLDVGRLEIDLSTDPTATTIVQRDIREGDEHRIQATPTIFLNGRRLVGRQSLETLKQMVNDILKGGDDRKGASAIGP